MKVVKGETRPLHMQLIRRHCVPLGVATLDKSSNDPQNLKYTGGTALLWETMEGRFFVTAHHVWHGLLEKLEQPSTKSGLFTCDEDGPVLIHLPTLVDESEDLDLAIFTVNGIKDFNPNGKEFLRTLTWPTMPAHSGEIVVGCGYPGAGLVKEGTRRRFRILSWMHKDFSVSQSGTKLILNGHGSGLATYYTKAEPKFSLPGISGSPLFVLRDTLDWVGVVRSASGDPQKGYLMQATPSNFIGADGHIRKP